MKKLFIFIFCLPLTVFALDPATVTVTNMRGESVSEASGDYFYRNETIHLTNCVAFSGTSTNSARQDLTGLTILVSVGDGVLAGQTVTGIITTATSGVWNASVTLRSDEGAKTYIQLRLTNSAASFVYPQKYINVKSKL
jgi:hypothetical protein